MSEMQTRPQTNGEAPLPRRIPKGLLPSTWLNRTVRLEYTGAGGEPASTSGTLLDYFPLGVCLNIEGVKTLVSHDRLVLVELQED